MRIFLLAAIALIAGIIAKEFDDLYEFAVSELDDDYDFNVKEYYTEKDHKKLAKGVRKY